VQLSKKSQKKGGNGMTRRYTSLVLAALIGALVLGACGGGAAPTAAPAAKAFTVEATEFAFSPNAFNAKVGDDITFTVTNAGTIEHNFVVFDPSGSEVSRTSIAVGAKATLNVKPATAGAYTIDCDIAGHKEAGMVATLTVTQ
jgi:plastocyanin